MFHFLFTIPLSKKLSGREIKPQWERFKTSMGEKSNPMGETPLKHWNQRWNIECQCFISWKHWLSMHCVMKMKHGTKKRLKVNIMYARARSASSLASNASLPAGSASSPGGDASPRRHLLVKARCLDKQIQYIFLLPSWGIDPQVGTRRQRTYIYTRGISVPIYIRVE